MLNWNRWHLNVSQTCKQTSTHPYRQANVPNMQTNRQTGTFTDNAPCIYKQRYVTGTLWLLIRWRYGPCKVREREREREQATERRFAWGFLFILAVLINWLIDWLIGWLASWLVDWLTGWLAGWLVGLLIFIYVSNICSIYMTLWS